MALMVMSLGMFTIAPITGTVQAANVNSPTIVTIDSEGNVGETSSIAVDSQGTAHIAYYDSTNGDLRYATTVSGQWYYWIIDDDEDVGYNPSIAIDSQDNVHISYNDYANGTLRYATNTGGSWNRWIVDNDVVVGDYSSIAIDSQDNVHISYYDDTNDDLRYANNTGGSWSKYIIDSEGDVGYYSSIAIDSHDSVHISYYNDTEGSLCYATNAGGEWNLWIIESNFIVGPYSSIAIDSKDHVHFSYYDYENYTLRYATDASGVPSDWLIDDNDDVGYDSSIAVDSQDNVHISYWNYSGRDLKYAMFSSNMTLLPGVPTGLTASPSDGQVLLNWTAPTSDGGEAIDYYVVYQNGTDVAHINATSIAITGLNNNVSYDFSVAAHNMIGTGQAGPVVSATPNASISLPGAPTGLTATPGNGQVQLNWDAPADSGNSAIIRYNLYWSLDPNSTFSSVLVTGTSYLHNGLTNEQTYYYKVAAVNQDGEGATSNMVSATPSAQTLVPSAPTNLAANAKSDRIELTWNAPSDNGGSVITGYMVYRGTGPNNMSQIATVTSTSYVDGSAEKGLKYYYSVVAGNANGAGQPSTTIDATIGEGDILSQITDMLNMPLEYILAGIAGLVAIVAAAIFLVTRRKKPKT